MSSEIFVQSPKVKGSICNIPISEIDNNCNSPPWPADSNGVIIVKLKRKAAYHGHALFEPVRPRLIESMLQYLKKHNHLYRNIEIDIENIPEELLSQIGNISEENAHNYLVKNITNPIDIISDSLVCNKDHEEINPSGIRISCSGILDDDCMNQEINDNARNDQKFYVEDSKNPLAQFQTPSAETTITTEIPRLDELEEGIVIALGECKKHFQYYMMISCEEMAHPHLFPTGKFGYKVKWKFHLTPSKYFKQRLLHYLQQFVSDTDYIFFTNAVMQKIQLNDQINIAMKKVASDSLNAGKLSKNFKATIQQFIAQDKVYSFMSSIKGTPDYWKKLLFEVLAVVKQLGIPTFFMTLSKI